MNAKPRFFFVSLFVLLFVSLPCAATPEAIKPRVFVLTDIQNEPDDGIFLMASAEMMQHGD